MGIARSTFYDLPTAVHDDTAIVEAIAAICEEFEFYGWRRVRAELRHRGMIVNHKKIRPLMREHDLQPRRRRRHVATTDSNHDQEIQATPARRTREALSKACSSTGFGICVAARSDTTQLTSFESRDSTRGPLRCLR
jgi:transposase InsO family protein